MENMVVLVTGGMGFIGSHLTETLLNKGFKVVVLGHKGKPGSYFDSLKLSQKTKAIYEDITKKRALFNVIKKNKINFIIHLAAKTIVNKCVKNPEQTLRTNIIGTVNVLEAVRTIKNIKGAIIASSDKAYGKTKKVYRENSSLRGDHPYDVSKSSADLIAQAYIKTYNTPVIITRSANVYGEGDPHKDRIIPGIVEAISKNRILKIRSNGRYKRDYIYVKDVINAYYFLLKNFDKARGEAFNISSRENYSVLELIKKIEKITGKKIRYKILNTSQNEIPYQQLNDEKLRKMGWGNKYTIKETIGRLLSF